MNIIKIGKIKNMNCVCKCMDCVHSELIKNDSHPYYKCNINCTLSDYDGNYGLTWFDGCPHFEMKMDIYSFSFGFTDSKMRSCTTELSVEPNHNITLDYKCKCGGDFEYEHRVLTSIPPQYPYRCNKCGKMVIKRADGTTYEW